MCYKRADQAGQGEHRRLLGLETWSALIATAPEALMAMISVAASYFRGGRGFRRGSASARTERGALGNKTLRAATHSAADLGWPFPLQERPFRTASAKVFGVPRSRCAH
jgi:hypothetical protein